MSTPRINCIGSGHYEASVERRAARKAAERKAVREEAREAAREAKLKKGRQCYLTESLSNETVEKSHDMVYRAFRNLEMRETRVAKEPLRPDEHIFLESPPPDGVPALHYAWTFQDHLPKDFYKGIPAELIERQIDPSKNFEKILTKEQCEFLDKMIAYELDMAFNKISVDDPFVAAADVPSSSETDVLSSSETDVTSSCDTDVTSSCDTDVTSSCDTDVTSSCDTDVTSSSETDVTSSSEATVLEDQTEPAISPSLADRKMEKVMQRVIEKEINKTLEREMIFRERNIGIPGFEFIKTLSAEERVLVRDICADDYDSFISHLEETSRKYMQQLKGVRYKMDYCRMKSPFHAAAELGRYQLLDKVLNEYYPSAGEFTQFLIMRWVNLEDNQLLPFQTALLSDSEGRFAVARLLLQATRPQTLKGIKTSVYSGLVPYTETFLGMVITAGNSEFTRYCLDQSGIIQLDATLKSSALLSLVCTGDVELLSHVWNMPCTPDADPADFCRATGGDTGFCAESPFTTAIMRDDVHMVRAILSIYPNAANVLNESEGVLPYQFAELVGASEELVNLLNGRCNIPFDMNQGPMGIIHVMKTALRANNESLYGRGLRHIMQFELYPEFSLPGLVKCAFFAEFYHIVEHILQLCRDRENLRRNMRADLTEFLALLLTSRDIPESVFNAMTDLLYDAGVTVNMALAFIRQTLMDREAEKEAERKATEAVKLAEERQEI